MKSFLAAAFVFLLHISASFGQQQENLRPADVWANTKNLTNYDELDYEAKKRIYDSFMGGTLLELSRKNGIDYALYREGFKEYYPQDIPVKPEIPLSFFEKSKNWITGAEIRVFLFEKKGLNCYYKSENGFQFLGREENGKCENSLIVNKNIGTVSK